MNRIKRVSLFFRIIFQILFITLPVILVIAWATSPESLVIMGGVINMSFIPRSYAHNILHILSPMDRLLGFGISSIPMLIELYILYSLIKLFGLYSKGEIFSANNVRHIQTIGYALLVTQMIHPFYEGLMGVALTRNNPHGHRFASVTLDQTNLGIICVALIVILISWIMAEGCKLREEQQLTI
jgi:hypothetical protein